MHDGDNNTMTSGNYNTEINLDQLATINPFVVAVDEQLVITWASKLMLKRVANIVGLSIPDIIECIEPREDISQSSIVRNIAMPHRIMIKDGDLILRVGLDEQQAEPMLEFWGQEDGEFSLGDKRKSFSLGERAEASVKKDGHGRVVLTIADTDHILERRPQGVSLTIEGRKEIILKPGEWVDALQRITPGDGIFFVDWILSLSPPENMKINLKELYDATAYIDVNEDDCLARGVRRSAYETGRNMSREEVLKKKEILQTTENPVIEEGFMGADFIIDNHSRFESILSLILEGKLTDSQVKPYLDELGIKPEELISIMDTIRETEKTSEKEAVITQLAYLEQVVREADIRFIFKLLQRIDRQRLTNNITRLQLNNNHELLQLIWLRLYMQTINPLMPKYKALCKLYDEVFLKTFLN